MLILLQFVLFARYGVKKTNNAVRVIDARVKFWFTVVVKRN
jgi:hypothetical protein